ncbi:Anti-anti-sigma regulatory factor (antagonist of anti-sigma factor) [Alteribacillus iranensis]|uniref:Anti-anti-sigma regulatory factor (Antagonist of anti-sigma factor) n=2 Tax=Alteribacillus iranensis TaxID=930128 RepID=A0A1I2D3S8_9BACI|nr:Anti-anti-sigma regulatory factor (antagonist of anti-sigma factor) [Alteribacillus iranensis]
MPMKNGQSIKVFIQENRERFEESLLSEAINVRDKIEEIRLRGNINLVDNAHQLVGYVVEEQTNLLTAFARQEGELWAKYSLTVDFKLEWVQAIRRTLWWFIQEYFEVHNIGMKEQDFFETERTINDQVDTFLSSFFIRYSQYKDELIESQKQLVEHLSVPVIPITESICVLPLIGAIDSERIMIIEEKILTEIRRLRISRLILDLSGVARMEDEAVDRVFRVMDGVNMMGCSTVITGLRPEIIQKMMESGHSFEQKAETKGTLQQALRDYVYEDQK